MTATFDRVTVSDRRSRWTPEEPWFHLFRIDIGDMTLIRYAQNGDQYVARWPSRTEFVRRETSATSVGPPEPVADLFASP